MKLLHVIESMGRGGAERHLANLLKPLRDLGAENHLVTLWPGRAYEDKVAPFVDRVELGLPPRRVLPALPALVRLARGADLVHTQLPWADIAGRAAGVVARRPIVTTLQTTAYRDANIDGQPPAVQKNLRRLRRLDALTTRASARFFAVSAAVKQTYVDLLGVEAARVDILPNTVDLDAFSPSALGDRADARAALGASPEEFAVLTVGRVVSTKRQEDAILAVAALAPQFPALRLYVAGAGPEEVRLKSLAHERRAPVVFLGARDDIPRLLYAADLFLFPTRFEGMPLSLLEAMAAGLPCLCSDIQENQDAAQEAARYAPCEDVPAFTRALDELLRDAALRARLSALGRERAKEYDARTVAARFLRAAEDVLRRRA